MLNFIPDMNESIFKFVTGETSLASVKDVVTGDGSYGRMTPADPAGAPGRTLVFSYAPSDMVRQAKLEALELKVRRKMLERKASLLDPHALTDGAAAAAAASSAAAAVRVSARSNADAVGSLGLVKSLVVPPELTEHGEEVRGSSEFIQDGERLEWQRPGRVAPDAAQAARPLLHYRTYEPGGGGKRPTAAAGAGKKKQWGMAVEPAAAANGAAARGSVSGAGRGGGGSGAAEVALASRGDEEGLYRGGGGGGWDGAVMCRPELKAQLSDGMLSYVPSKFERPKGVESTAFVPQAQAIEEARSKYVSGKQRRPASAPPRRVAAADPDGANAVRSADADGGAAATAVAAPAAATAAATAAGRGPSDGGGGWIPGGSASLREPKQPRVMVARVEETDLFAMYRARSQQQQQEQQIQPQRQKQQPPAGPAARSSRTNPRAATAAAAAGRAAPSTNGAGDAGRGPVDALSVPTIESKSIATPTTIPAATAAPADSFQHRGLPVKVRQRPATAVAAAGTSPPGIAWSAGGPTGRSGAAAKKPPVAPATAAEAAALLGGGRPWSSRPPSARQLPGLWTRPRPPSPSISPGNSRPPSQRRISAPPWTGSGGAAGGSGGGAVTAGNDDFSAGAGPRVGYQAVSPETRRQVQSKYVSTASTAKTNRLRGAARSGSGAAPHGVGGAAAAAVDGGGISGIGFAAKQPAWSSSSATAPPPCDRSLLQERILGGLARQYTFGEDDDIVDGSAAAADAGPTVVMPPRRPVRPRSAVNAPTSAGGGGGGGGGGGFFSQQSAGRTGYLAEAAEAAQQLRRTYEPPPPPQPPQPPQRSSSSLSDGRSARPQSAPSRRVRPPSAGHWAGRPDPKALLARSSKALQYNTTGVLYDPELQPSPLDSYMNQLNGLD